MSNIAEVLTAGQSKRFNVTGRFVRLMSATGAVEITYFINGSEIGRTGNVQAGYAEEFDEVFDAFTVVDKSGAGNTIEILYRMNSRARYDRSAGNVAITNTQNSPIPVSSVGQGYGGAFVSNTALGANAAQVVVAPGANLNGVIIHRAQLKSYNSTAVPMTVLIAKASAPAGVIDGDVILSPDTFVGGYTSHGKLEDSIVVPAGKGLYFISDIGESGALSFRNLLYTIK